jgi:glyoxylase-like metal-dependent hydrolase (beta-lactamase superfamily II)
MPVLMRLVDGGPSPVAGTLLEGDTVAGFEVVHLPGHAPGLIALWRQRDRLALCSDCFYTTGGRGPEVPKVAYNQDTSGARQSMRKLAGLGPTAAWPGHAGPVLGNVAEALRRASEAPIHGDPA